MPTSGRYGRRRRSWVLSNLTPEEHNPTRTPQCRTAQRESPRRSVVAVRKAAAVARANDNALALEQERGSVGSAISAGEVRVDAVKRQTALGSTVLARR